MPNPSVMILLEEAVERLNAAGSPYGVRLSRWKNASRAVRRVDEIATAFQPLELPDELRAFWSGWDPSSLQWPVFDGFIPLHHIVDRRELEYPPWPAVLVPIADWTQARIWVELGTRAHPGGRIFHSYQDESALRLWAFGVSGLLDLVSETLERDLINDRTGDLHETNFTAVVKRALDSQIGEAVPRTYEGISRIGFPEHWRDAEGLARDHFELRGATHTVRTLGLQRQTTESVSATLVGTYETSVGGGPLQGCVGVFSDATGELQVFVPQLTGLAGAVGQDGGVEIDVLAVAPNGSGLRSLSAKNDLQQAVSGGQYDYDNDIVVRLFEQMKHLDTSVVVTGLRPIN